MNERKRNAEKKTDTAAAAANPFQFSKFVHRSKSMSFVVFLFIPASSTTTTNLI